MFAFEDQLEGLEHVGVNVSLKVVNVSEEKLLVLEGAFVPRLHNNVALWALFRIQSALFCHGVAFLTCTKKKVTGHERNIFHCNYFSRGSVMCPIVSSNTEAIVVVFW